MRASTIANGLAGQADAAFERRITEPPLVPALAASDDEQQTFSIFEGGFFGNLFTLAPVAYTCRGERTLVQEGDPILQERVCTQATDTTTADGQPLTHCHFILTGRCADAASFTIQNTQYAEVIFTYLKPRQALPTPRRTPDAPPLPAHTVDQW